jgi:hypothetical protein
MSDEQQRVVVTRMFSGICHMQVCAHKDATDEEILAVCNRENPAGTSNGWASVVKEDSEFWQGVAPVQCADDPNRMHYMVAC